MMKYNKLVRDKIPDIIEKKGGVAKTHIANDAEFWEKLRDKLVEEAEEFRKDPSVNELADIWEVIDAIIAHQKFDQKEIWAAKTKKGLERGRFEQRIILDES